MLASDNKLWSNLFVERWGGDKAAFYAPDNSKPWKNVYEVQDRCDRIGLYVIQSILSIFNRYVMKHLKSAYVCFPGG